MVVSASPMVTGLGGVFVNPRTESCSSQRWDFLATTQGVVSRPANQEHVGSLRSLHWRSVPGNLEILIYT